MSALSDLDLATVWLDPPTMLWVGALMALAARREIEAARDRGAGPPARPRTLALAYAGLFFLPVTGYFFYRWTAWSIAYIRPPAEVATWDGELWLGAVALFSYFGAGACGYLVSEALVRRGRPAAAAGFTAAAFAVYATIFAATWRDYFSLPPEEEAFKRDMNVGGLLLGLPAAGVILRNILVSRRLKNMSPKN